MHRLDVTITTALLLYRFIFDWSLFDGIYFMFNLMRFYLLFFRNNFYQWFWYRCSIRSIVIYWRGKKTRKKQTKLVKDKDKTIALRIPSSPHKISTFFTISKYEAHTIDSYVIETFDIQRIQQMSMFSSYKNRLSLKHH